MYKICQVSETLTCIEFKSDCQRNCMRKKLIDVQCDVILKVAAGEVTSHSVSWVVVSRCLSNESRISPVLLLFNVPVFHDWSVAMDFETHTGQLYTVRKYCQKVFRDEENYEIVHNEELSKPTDVQAFMLLRLI